MMTVALGVVTWHSYSPLSPTAVSRMRTAHLSEEAVGFSINYCFLIDFPYLSEPGTWMAAMRGSFVLVISFIVSTL